MSFAVGEFIVGPSSGLMELLKYLLFVVFIVHLPFIFMAIGGSALSLLFNFLDKDRPNPKFLRFSQELIERSIFNPWVGLILGVIPLATAILLYYQYLYQTPLVDFSHFWGEVPFDVWKIMTPTFPYHWWASVFFVALGLSLLYVYQNTFALRKDKFLLHFASGLLGLVLIIKGWFVFIAHETFLLYPTMWGLVDNPLQMIFGSNILTSFGYFLHIAFAFAGAAILFSFLWIRRINQNATAFILIAGALIPLPIFLKLLSKSEGGLSGMEAVKYLGLFLIATLVVSLLGFLFFDRKSQKKSEEISEEEEDYLKFVKKIGTIVTLIFTLGLPIPLFLNLFFMEEPAVSNALVASYFVTIFVAMILALVLAYSLFNLEKSSEKWIVPLAFISIFFFIFNNQTTLASALHEQILFLKDHASAQEKEIPIPGEGAAAGPVSKLPPAAQKGFMTFKSKCYQCHTISGAQKVGPSFKDLWETKRIVITDNKERTLTVDKDYLKNSILSPLSDIVKGFPPAMPPQNLDGEQISQVIEFIKAIKTLKQEELDQLDNQAKQQ